jgi:carboxyl-terminal processing protease
MKNKITVITIIAAIMVSAYWVGFSLGKESDNVYKELDIFAEAMALVDQKYAEVKKPKELVYGAISGLLNSLDAYSQFLTPEEHKELITETEGKFGGLGIEITMKNGYVTIISPLEDTPAWKAGLEPEDIIIKISGESTKNITLSAAVKKLRGEPGTKVDLTILKAKQRKLEDMSIVRGLIKIKDIKRALVLENNIGYVRIAEFRENTAGELDKALHDLKKSGLKGLIIDVRNNPGGLLYTAIDVSSRFLEDGKEIVSTRSRSEPESIYKAVPAPEKVTDIPLVVLINKGSASGSEILAAALRDNKRAVLLGETSFGKGSVQTIVPLSDGSALRLTTSKYYTPNKISIHEKGIDPDIAVAEETADKDKKEKTDVVEEVQKKIEEIEKKEEKKDEFNYKKDIQIMRALDLLKGLLVLSDTGKENKKALAGEHKK